VFDVVDVDEAATVDIENFERFHTEIFPELVHFTADIPDELIV